MSKSTPAATGTLDPPSAPADARDVVAFRQRADALCRCAIECIRLHERHARLVREGGLSVEIRAARSLVVISDEALIEMAAIYETSATRECADSDAACWQAANAMWMASREFASRVRTTTRAGRNLGDGKHSTERLGELTIDYDLEASALLQLRHATDAYRRLRPSTAG